MKPSKKLPLHQALFFIFISIFAISGTCHLLLKAYTESNHQKEASSDFYLKNIIQTGSNRDALKSEFLAELLDLSKTNPTSIFRFDPKSAVNKLYQSPLIKWAEVKLVYPDTIYVDYEMRSPIALLYDFENTAFDEDGVVFPFYPFYTPKKLTSVYLGLSQDHLNFGEKIPMQKLLLIKEVLGATESLKATNNLFLTWLDVSKAYESSLGQKEIIACIEGQGLGQNVEFEHFLRLTTTNYLQDLGNYLKMNQEILVEPSLSMQSLTSKLKMFDFRVGGMAIIKDPP